MHPDVFEIICQLTVNAMDLGDPPTKVIGTIHEIVLAGGDVSGHHLSMVTISALLEAERRLEERRKARG